MNTRRIAFTLGVAGGGLVAAAFLQAAVATADDAFGFVPDPGYAPRVEYTDGLPPLYQNVLGYDEFNWVDLTKGTTAAPDVVGTFNADTSDVTTAFGITNEELLVDSADLSGVHPAVGSVFDITNFGGGFENVYTDLVGAGPSGANLITDVLETPLGFDVTIPTTFDAAADVVAGSIFP